MTMVGRGTNFDCFIEPFSDYGVDCEVFEHEEQTISKKEAVCEHVHLLVAKAPGNHIMAYLCTSGSDDGKVVKIDKCKTNRLYKALEPLVPLLHRLEELLMSKKVKEETSIQIQIDLSESCKSGNMFAKLGYTTATFPGQIFCRWSKTLLLLVEESEAEASTSAPALPSQAQRQRGRASQASQASPTSLLVEESEAEASTSAPVLLSQAQRRRGKASQASTTVVASISAPRRGGSETAAVASTSASRRGGSDTDSDTGIDMARLEPSDALPSSRPISPEVVHTHKYINSASNAEFDLDPSHKGWKCIGTFGGCQFWLSPALDAVMIITES